MIDDPGALAETFAGTLLDGREVKVYELPDNGAVVFSVDVEQAELVPVWSVARGLVHRTGRWPHVGWYNPPTADLSTIDFCRGSDVDEGSAERLRAVGESIFSELRTAMEESTKSQSWWQPLEGRLEYELAVTQRRYGSAPEAGEILARFPSDLSDVDLERWLLDWEEQQRPTTAPVDFSHLDWFWDPPASLMFYPTASGPCSIAYDSFYGEEAVLGMTTEKLITILEYWRHEYGAELVADWGTMLQFLVSRPPSNLEEAWKLAVQQLLVAPGTIYLPTIPLRDHARALFERPTWFLHGRP